jgi:hypothetical protein
MNVQDYRADGPTRVTVDKPKTSSKANDLENRKRRPFRCIALLARLFIRFELALVRFTDRFFKLV